MLNLIMDLSYLTCIHYELSLNGKLEEFPLFVSLALPRVIIYVLTEHTAPTKVNKPVLLVCPQHHAVSFKHITHRNSIPSFDFFERLVLANFAAVGRIYAHFQVNFAYSALREMNATSIMGQACSMLHSKLPLRPFGTLSAFQYDLHSSHLICAQCTFTVMLT